MLAGQWLSQRHRATPCPMDQVGDCGGISDRFARSRSNEADRASRGPSLPLVGLGATEPMQVPSMAPSMGSFTQQVPIAPGSPEVTPLSRDVADSSQSGGDGMAVNRTAAITHGAPSTEYAPPLGHVVSPAGGAGTYVLPPQAVPHPEHAAASPSPSSSASTPSPLATSMSQALAYGQELRSA